MREGKEKKGEKKKGKEKKKRNERKTKERRKKNVRGKEGKKEERNEKGSDSWCSDGRKLLVQELKLVYSTRTTSRFQKQKEIEFSHTLVPPNLRAVNSHVVQP